MRLLITAYRGVSAVSRLIRWQTWSDYSHVGLAAWEDGVALPDVCSGCPTVEAWQTDGVRAGYRGPCAGHIPGTRIDLFEVPAAGTHEKALAAWDFATTQVGRPYDWLGVLRFLPRRAERRAGDARWFCSELVMAAFAAAGVELLVRVPASRVSPGLVVLSPLLRYAGSCQWPAGHQGPIVFADPALDPCGQGRMHVCGVPRLSSDLDAQWDSPIPAGGGAA